MTLQQAKSLLKSKNPKEYLSAIQDKSVVMLDLLATIELLYSFLEGHNARGTLITLAREKVFWLDLALDRVNLPPP